jgi:hypothetical protein
VANPLVERPFDNFRVAITDPLFFHGREDLIDSIKRSPFQVRIFLGGRRIGKTSLLRAIEWSLLEPISAIDYSQGQNIKAKDHGWLKQFFPTFARLINSKGKSSHLGSKGLSREKSCIPCIFKSSN